MRREIHWYSDKLPAIKSLSSPSSLLTIKRCWISATVRFPDAIRWTFNLYSTNSLKSILASKSINKHFLSLIHTSSGTCTSCRTSGKRFVLGDFGVFTTSSDEESSLISDAELLSRYRWNKVSTYQNTSWLYFNWIIVLTSLIVVLFFIIGSRLVLKN